MEFHPAAAIYELLEDDDLSDLAASIRVHGLKEAVKTLDGKIIDGRNRYRACLLSGVTPDYESVTLAKGELPADYVFTVNDQRRHLDHDARSLAAAKYKKQAASEAKERQKVAGKEHGRGKQKLVAPAPQAIARGPAARDEAAAKFDVGAKSVDAAEHVLDKGSAKLQDALKKKAVSLKTAARLAKCPKKVQDEALAQGPKAIKAAIETHAPTLNETAKNDPGRRWHKLMHDLWKLSNSIRDAGGVNAIVKLFTADQRRDYVSQLRDLTEELQEWTKSLTDN